ncbi:hypothetical protein [Clostridium sp.]
MRNIISIIAFLLLAVFIFQDYLREKKIYKLLVILTGFILTFSNKSFVGAISKTLENTIMVIIAILVISIFYLIIKDIIEKRNSKK